MVIQRFFTALFMILAVGGVIFFAPTNVFRVLVLAVVGRVLQEFFRLCFPTVRFYQYCGTLSGLVIASILIWPPLNHLVLPALISFLFIICCIQMAHADVLEHVPQRIGLTTFGVLYVACTLPFFASLYDLPHGKALVVMAIAMAAFGDTFAMFAGKLIGRHKMTPVLSPNKTWEGLAAGFLGSCFGGILVKFSLWPELPLNRLIGLGLIIGIIGPLGDLIESMVKRAYHVKDAGALLPGHGGVLDRADALIFTAPTVYYYSKSFFL